MVTKFTEYVSFHGPNALRLSIEHMAKERGISLSEDEIRRLVRDAVWASAKYIHEEFKKYGRNETTKTEDRPSEASWDA